MEFFASCLAGFEKVLADELRSLGIERVRPLGGGVAFFCEIEQAYRACLWSRIASRVMMVIARVDASDAGTLYRETCEIAWEEVLARDATFAVRAHGTNDELRNTRFTALKVKDALMDRMQEVRNRRPQVDTTSPRAAIDVRVRERRATISLDFSGEALNRRSYLLPDDAQDAPLECSIAAGSLALGAWGDGGAIGGSAFVDPACRDGVLLVEAASVACDLAPGLERKRWGFFGWANHDEELWRGLVEEAQARFERGLEKVFGEGTLDFPSKSPPDLRRVRFVGASTSSPSIAHAREQVRRAGLRQIASVELGDASSIGTLVDRAVKASRRNSGKNSTQDSIGADSAMINADRSHETRPLECVIACNFDSHSRSDAQAQIKADEATYVAACSSAPKAARFIAIGAQDVGLRFGVATGDVHVVGKGRIETTVEIFDERPLDARFVEVPDLAGGASRQVEVLEASSEQFASRLRKVFKERRKWAVREGISCYRIYDSDLPDYAVSIDWYTGAGSARGNNYLHISEYAPPASVDADKARRRFGDVLALAPVVCGVRPDHVFSKRRVREKGGSQYRNAGRRSYPATVEEGGYRFEVDLSGRIDTGLFLDHRVTRELIALRAAGTRFLNLFAYTGAATVYAAGGGAKSTMTIDLSQTYLDWAQRNMRENGFEGDCHKFEKADVMRWITEARRSGRRFDFVFVDPPTFSNSKAMGRKTWDVQRDHVELLIGVTRLLSEGGQALFSCNLRSFKPYVEDLERYGVDIEDISASTIPHDFSRTPKIHKCYIVRRR